MVRLTWFVGGSLDKAAEGLSGAGMGQKHRLLADYRPSALRLHVSEAPKSVVTYDVRLDGVSLFDNRPQIDADVTFKDYDVFKESGESTLSKDGELTLHMTSMGTKGSGRDLTVELDLEEID